ncbi:BadF/BadG/BcrA/BcrD ATPase family protein [Lactobacillus johnsonii]|uniref:BadF/BadG/BcrA/BcrD ATPase family protein n=1 Tax=Lactobacillus johnsonii TaxID=33959 RepID=UPI001F583D69|nr:BadF/BadG/BcrA/BcrD ATPase family protein [Lactobacillus johnsonii]UNL60539.1 N-acetylglucosamine kinase [Lactobacillus johnsonii]
MSYAIGVDSGGTHITATAYKNHFPIASTTNGPGNILIDPNQTTKNLIEAIGNLVKKYSSDSCSCILIGIAGLESAKNPAPYLDEIKNHFRSITTNITFISDAKLALINGLEGKDGFLAIAGTGSIVYGKQGNKYLRAGGWGYLLDDVGSGYRITQEAVSTALEKMDIGKQSSLTPTILEYFREDSLKNVVSRYYTLSRPEIAAFSLKIAHVAEQGNKEAINILIHQATLLANEIIYLIKRYPQNNISLNLALSGSVLINNPIIQKEIISTLKKSYPSINIMISSRSNTAAVNYI